jgi:hypothetical protein
LDYTYYTLRLRHGRRSTTSSRRSTIASACTRRSAIARPCFERRPGGERHWPHGDFTPTKTISDGCPLPSRTMLSGPLEHRDRVGGMMIPPIYQERLRKLSADGPNAKHHKDSRSKRVFPWSRGVYKPSRLRNSRHNRGGDAVRVRSRAIRTRAASIRSRARALPLSFATGGRISSGPARGPAARSSSSIIASPKKIAIESQTWV